MSKYLSLIIVAAVAVATIGFVAMRSNDTKNTNTGNTSSSQEGNAASGSSDINTPVVVDKVSINDLSFTPANIKVKKGTTVTWTNNDSTAHTISQDASGGPDSQNLEPGDTFNFTFNEVGTFGYHCNIHQEMHGTVEVTD